MRKAEKRALGEAKAKRETEQRRQDGLAAQRADHERTKKRVEALNTVTSGMNQKNRSTLLKKGINPSTGVLFTDEEMAEMKAKAEASRSSERRHLYYQIEAGRAGTLNEQPPLGSIDDYVGPLPEMTVGDFKAMADAFYTKSQERMRRETASNPERALEFAKALTIGGFFQQAGESLERMAAGSKKAQEALQAYNESDVAFTEEMKDTRFPTRFMETQEAMKLFTRPTEDTSAAHEVYGMRRRGVDPNSEKYSDGTSEDRMPRRGPSDEMVSERASAMRRDGYTVVEINEALSTFNESGSSE